MPRFIAGLIFALMAVTLYVGPARAEATVDAYIVVDATSGRVLAAKNPDVRLYPASMTKIMTLYLTFEALSQGRLSLNTQLSVSQLAAAQAPSKLGLHAGSQISVQDCIYAAVTLSANDCAMVLAENIGGSEDEFARLMTSRAHSLGMVNTHWNNPNGLPDDGQLTTARDMAILAQATIQRFPKYYRYFSTASFTYHGIRHPNHNHLMEHYPGMDGIKTGFIRASGFNLTASAVRQNHRLITVVFGGISARSRDEYMAGLLDDGFRRIAGQPGAAEMSAAFVAVAPPEKPNGMTAAIRHDNTSQVAGVSLAEAGDDVENGEGGSPATAIVAEPVQPVVATPAVTPQPPHTPALMALSIPDKMLEEPDDTPAGKQAQAAKPAPAPQMAEGDIDSSEAPQTLPHVLSVPAQKVAPVKAHWGVQIGTYSSRAVSDAMLQKAVAILPIDIRSRVKPVSVAVHHRHAKPYYRAQLTGLDQLGAHKACSVLAHCVPVKA